MCDKTAIKSQIDEISARIGEPDADAGAVASLYYERGRLYWRIGDRGAAMSDYAAAVHLDPDSPAATALKMASDIMDFYNKDLYNP